MSDFENFIKSGEVKLSPNDMIRSIEFFDRTVELIGMVETMNSPIIVGKENHKLLKFILSNRNGCRIQIKVWGEQIPRVIALIRPNNILHIDGASSKGFDSSNFNEGNVHYELTIQSNTIITLIKNVEINDTSYDESVKDYKFEDLGKAKSSDLIKIQGYLKTNFHEAFDKGSKFLVACITDGNHKLEVRIFSLDDFNKEILIKGVKLEIIGTVIFEKPVFFKVQSFDKVKVIENEKMTEEHLNKGIKRIYREMDKEDDSEKSIKLIKI